MKKLAFLIVAILFVSPLTGFSGNTNLPDDRNNTLTECSVLPVPFHTEMNYYAQEEIDLSTGMVYIDAYGTGNATHMGLTDMEIHEIVDTNGFCPCTWDADADVVLTAANGDELHFSYTSSIDASVVFVTGELTIVGTCNITGGTGRFTDASGSLIYTGNYSVVNHTGTCIFEGKIMY